MREANESIATSDNLQLNLFEKRKRLGRQPVIFAGQAVQAVKRLNVVLCLSNPGRHTGSLRLADISSRTAFESGKQLLGGSIQFDERIDIGCVRLIRLKEAIASVETNRLPVILAGVFF